MCAPIGQLTSFRVELLREEGGSVRARVDEMAKSVFEKVEDTTRTIVAQISE
jgi:hypothetical protein